MALPTFQAAGAIQSATTTITVAWPAHLVDDVALLVIETANEAVSLTTPAGFVEVAGSPFGTGTAGGTAATRLTVFWARATSTSMASPVTNDPGNHVIGRIFTWRGCIKSGNPWDVTAGDVEATGSTTVSVPGAATTVIDCLVVALCTNPVDATAGQANGTYTNADLANIAERANQGAIAGNGGGWTIVSGEKATAGAYTTTGMTLATAVVQGRMSIALRPPVPTPQAVAVVGSGTVALVTNLVRAQAVAVAGAGTVALTPGLVVSRTIAVAGAGTVALTRTVSYAVAVAVAGAGTVVLTLQLSFLRTIAVVGAGVAALATLFVPGPGGACGKPLSGLRGVLALVRTFVTRGPLSGPKRLDQ